MGDKELGERLKKARESKNFKQADVCTRLEIPKVQTLSAYERGQNNPPIDTLKKLSELYQVSTDELLFGKRKDYTSSISPREYFINLVNAVDTLNLMVFSSGNDRDPEYCVNLTQYHHYEHYLHFIHCWVRFRKLLDDGLIDSKEYAVLINRKLEDIYDFDLPSPSDPFSPSDPYNL